MRIQQKFLLTPFSPQKSNTPATQLGVIRLSPDSSHSWVLKPAVKRWIDMLQSAAQRFSNIMPKKSESKMEY